VCVEVKIENCFVRDVKIEQSPAKIDNCRPVLYLRTSPCDDACGLVLRYGSTIINLRRGLLNLYSANETNLVLL
jgi:hypothetical protein